MPLPEGIVRDDALYVEFISEWGFPLDFGALEQDKEDPDFQLLNIREEERERNDALQYRYCVTLMMTQGGVGNFIKKIGDYLEKNGRYRGQDTGNPSYYKLFTNIDLIQQATLRSFWTDEPEHLFPEAAEDLWWEAWFRKTGNDEFRMRRVLDNLEAAGVQIGRSELVFAEHRVKLIKGTATQLAGSLLLLDNLAELRKPQETADFISHQEADFEEQAE